MGEVVGDLVKTRIKSMCVREDEDWVFFGDWEGKLTQWKFDSKFRLFLVRDWGIVHKGFFNSFYIIL